MRSIFVIAVVLLVATGTAYAQTDQTTQTEKKEQQKSYLYKWIDDKGIAHVTDNIGNVPKKYRGKVIILEQFPSKEEPTQKQQDIVPPSRPVDEQRIEEDKKAEWQQRMKDARKRLADAQQRYQELAQKRTEALEKWGGVASGQLEGRIEAERLDQEMKQVQKEIDDARNEVEVVIPESARKAGIPPGWLRE